MQAVEDRRITFRPYSDAYRGGCLGVFDSNVPRYFTDAERPAFETFLDALPGPYMVLVDSDDEVVGCGGYAVRADGLVSDLCWGMIRADHHGRALGRLLARARIDRALADPRIEELRLETTQHTAGFYEKLGFQVEKVEENGYAQGLHRCLMVRPVSDPLVTPAGASAPATPAGASTQAIGTPAPVVDAPDPSPGA